MKQTVDNQLTSEYTNCNGHQNESNSTRKDSDNDESCGNSPTSSSLSSSNLNTHEVPSSPAAAVVSTDGNANELVVLPESSFTIRIQSSGLDIFDLPVTSSELVQEIHQVLMDKEETCHRTCFSLQLEGNILDNFTELKNIENLKDGSLLKVIEGSFFPLNFIIRYNS